MEPKQRVPGVEALSMALAAKGGGIMFAYPGSQGMPIYDYPYDRGKPGCV